jgi:hypothetical protein
MPCERGYKNSTHSFSFNSMLLDSLTCKRALGTSVPDILLRNGRRFGAHLDVLPWDIHLASRNVVLFRGLNRAKNSRLQCAAPANWPLLPVRAAQQPDLGTSPRRRINLGDEG